MEDEDDALLAEIARQMEAEEAVERELARALSDENDAAALAEIARQLEAEEAAAVEHE